MNKLRTDLAARQTGCMECMRAIYGGRSVGRAIFGGRSGPFMGCDSCPASLSAGTVSGRGGMTYESLFIEGTNYEFVFIGKVFYLFILAMNHSL